MQQKLVGTFFRNTISLFAIRTVVAISSIIAMIWLARILPREQYAAYQFVIVCSSLCTAIGSLGIGSVVFNYSDLGFRNFLKGLSTKGKLYYALLLLVLSSVFTCIIHFSGHFIYEPGIVGPYLLFVFVVFSFALEQILLIGRGRKWVLFVNFCFALLWLGAHYMSVDGKNFSLKQFIGIWVVLLLAKIIALLGIYNHKTSQPSADEPDIRASKKAWWQLGFYEVFQLIVRQLDKLIVPYLSSASAAAAYYNGRIEIPLLPALLSSVRSAALLRLTHSNNDTNSIKKTIQQAFSTLSSVGIPLVIFGVTFSKTLIDTVFTEKYADTVPIFIGTLLILPAQYCISLSYVLQYKDRADIINKGAIGDLILTLVLVYPLYQAFGSLGIVLSVLISTYIQSIYYLVKASASIRIQILQLLPLKDYFVKIVVALILSQLAFYISTLLQWNNLLTLICAISLGAIVVGIFFAIEFKNSTRYHHSHD